NASCRTRSTEPPCVPSRQDPAAALADILENLKRIESYVAGLDREAFGAGHTSASFSRAMPETHLRGHLFAWGEKAAELAPSQPWPVSVVWVNDCVTLRPYQPRCLVEHGSRQLAQLEGRSAAALMNLKARALALNIPMPTTRVTKVAPD